MNPEDHLNGNGVLKLIFAILAALFAVMTSIGGFTASHLIGQVDNISSGLTDLKVKVDTQSTANEIYRLSMENRLQRIEKKLDGDK